MVRRVGASGRISLPHAFLAGWFALAAAQLLLNAVQPPLPTTDSGYLGALSAVAVVLALLTGAAAVFRGNETTLLVLLLLAEALLAVVVLVAAGGQGQFMAGLYLLVLGLIAGLSLHRRGVALVLAVGIPVYLAALMVNPLLDSPGYAVFAAIVIVLVTLVVSSLVASLREQAIHDQLTGALNRRGLEQAAALAHELATREGKPTALVEIDLDGFKAYNDEFGHSAGDDRLAQLVVDWRQVLRRTDLLARIGGDEFVLVMPGASADEAAEFVGRMRAVNDVPWTAGVSTWAVGEPLAEAFARADVLMYDGKRSRPGRETPGVN